MVSLARQTHVARKLIGLAVALLALSIGLWFLVGRPHDPVDAHAGLRVMTYSSFMSAWGPGPDLAKKFKDETGIAVEFQDAGDAGLILEKLKLFPVDVVVGLDGLSVPMAKARLKWQGDFVEIDHAPLAFIYRTGEIEPPVSLEDLLSPRFKGAIALEDPRTSTPGLQFFLWVLDEMGEAKGFDFLKALKPNIHSVSSSWSGAYGSFTKKQSKIAFSYLTSPLYHLLEEKDSSYVAAVFATGHPVQTEYAAVPADCARCTDGEKFIQFLRRSDNQAIIMRKNFMLPAVAEAATGTPFATVQAVTVRELRNGPSFLGRRDELFAKWQQLGL